LCYLLGIPNSAALSAHYLRGNIFENFIIADIFKQFHHSGLRSPLFFWRDHRGNEVDLLIEQGDRLIPVEIKSGETLNEDFLKGLRYFDSIQKGKVHQGILIYGGLFGQARGNIKILSWTDLRRGDFLENFS
jgi:predicted AAA+ superfamily ATPase